METTRESSVFKDPTRPIEGTTASFQLSGSAHQDDFGCIWKLSLLNTEKLDQATPGIASHHKIEPEFQNEVNTRCLLFT
jgi:hypothetical protein